MASVTIFLFGKPEWEFGEKVSAKEIRSKGDELKSRLYEIAETLQKLSAENWETEMGLYDIMLYKDISKAAAKRELERLGIKDGFLLEEEWD